MDLHVLAADCVIHVCLDATRCDDIDGDLLVAEVWFIVLVCHATDLRRNDLPRAMHLANVSIVPLLPE